MLDVQRGKIGADHLHHPAGRGSAHIFKPFAFRAPKQPGAISFDKRGTNAFQIIAWVKALWDLSDLPAKRLPVAQIGGTGQNIDLGTRVIDIVFAGDVMTGKSQRLLPVMTSP